MQRCVNSPMEMICHQKTANSLLFTVLNLPPISLKISILQNMILEFFGSGMFLPNITLTGFLKIFIWIDQS